METKNTYADLIAGLQKQISVLKHKKRRLGIARLFSFLAAIILFFALLGINGIWATTIAIVLLLIFLFVTLKDMENIRRLRFCKRLLTINEEEIMGLEGNHSAFADGTIYHTDEHGYVNDLDIFGKHSLFQFINRTTASPSADLLADWISHPAAKEQILLRQNAIKTLQPDVKWRQHLQATGRQFPIDQETYQQLMSWAESTDEAEEKKARVWITNIILSLTIIFIALAYTGILPWKILWISFCLHLLTIWQLGKIVTPSYSRLSKAIHPLESFQKSLQWILSKKFDDPYLATLQARCYDRGKPAHQLLDQLKGILNRLDLRLNPLVHFPLNLLIFWDWRQYRKLQRWRRENCRTGDLQSAGLSLWIEVYTETEVLASFANMAFNHPDWCFPEIAEQHFTFSAQSLGHPLIHRAKRVCNDATLNGTGKIMLITGSNMAGKSTFLRTIGINIVLAMAGAPVCAKKMSISEATVLSSMRIADNLEENISTFYAELKKLETIIKRVRAHDKVILLLDEILRGTNSNDRHAGAKALIGQLLTEDAVGIVATHDLALTEMEEEHKGQLSNFHFDVQVFEEELFFDYKLKPGICTSMNASLLMRKIGINV